MRKRRACGAAPTLSGGQFVASAPKGGSVDHPPRRRSPSLDRKGQGDADPQARRRRSRPADRPRVRSRPGERDGSIAEARPEAVDPKADERGPQGSQHRARGSDVASRRAQRRARGAPASPRCRRPAGSWNGGRQTRSRPRRPPSPRWSPRHAGALARRGHLQANRQVSGVNSPRASSSPSSGSSAPRAISWRARPRPRCSASQIRLAAVSRAFTYRSTKVGRVTIAGAAWGLREELAASARSAARSLAFYSIAPSLASTASRRSATATSPRSRRLGARAHRGADRSGHAGRAMPAPPPFPLVRSVAQIVTGSNTRDGWGEWVATAPAKATTGPSRSPRCAQPPRDEGQPRGRGSAHGGRHDLQPQAPPGVRPASA
jgi:hypothetical protein